jgi:hypothetical protein
MLYADGDHTGIVTAVHAGGGFETIEGNARHGGYRFWTAIH